MPARLPHDLIYVHYVYIWRRGNFTTQRWSKYRDTADAVIASLGLGEIKNENAHNTGTAIAIGVHAFLAKVLRRSKVLLVPPSCPLAVRRRT